MNNLIYGKNNLEKIVSIEVDGSEASVFIRDSDSIKVQKIPHRYWILTDNKYPDFIKLKGDLYYQYGRQFKNQEEYFAVKNKLKNKDYYSIHDFKEALQVKDGLTYFKGMNPKDLHILSFDLETTTIDHNEDSKILLISTTFVSPKGINKKLFAYDEYSSPGEMIQDFCTYVCAKDPDIILGHNINSFDIPYLQFIAAQEEMELLLGRNGSALKTNTYESKFRKDGTQFYHYKKHKIYGREIIDTFFLALKYDVGRKYESYGLKQIIKQEGLEKQNRVFYDTAKIRTNYKISAEWEKIKQYCVDDSDDALSLFNLMAPSFFYLAQSIPKPFQSIIEGATGSQLNALMVRAYLQQGHSIPKTSERSEYEGAISLGNPGIYHNVWKVDVASLYPSIMIQYEVYDKEKDPKGYFKEIVKIFTEERLKNKKLAKTSKYHDDLQNAQKIVINSAYGFLGAPGLNFNYPEGAAFITKKGREILSKAIEWSKTLNFKLINADTDSISISKGDSSFFDENERKELLNALNSQFPPRIRFEDDGYFHTVLVSKIKNYVLWDGKKLKIKGSSLKDPKRELALQEFIKEIIQTMIDKKYDYLTIYNKYVKEILNLKDIKRWASKKTITDKVLNGERLNETKVKDAISESEYKEGDKIWVYFDKEDKLKLVEDFDGNYRIDRLLKKLYMTAKIFQNLVDISIFPNYSLKRNTELLKILGGIK